MATLELVLLLLAAVLASAVINQLVPKVPATMVQILLGICLELLTADSVTINVSTEFFLILFIAPLLYDEARNADKHALLRNIKPVLGMAVGLVLVTMFAIGGVVHWMIPAIPFAAAAALGAALGPTDAVAVSSLPKDVNIGERRKKLLQGEYLLNDASGIVGFQFALAVVVTGHFSALNATAEFLICFFGGLLVGALLGGAANLIENYIRSTGLEKTSFHVLFDLFLPFIIYLCAEPLGASGIIAVVVGGLIRSLQRRVADPIDSRLQIVSGSVWETISFTLNGAVFVLLGTQLPRAMTYTMNNPAVGTFDLLLWVLVITLVLLVTRFVWLLGEEYLHHRPDGWKLFGKNTMQSALIMTIAGPKGAVTLSIIFTIPVLLSAESFFPERSLIIFLASGVILLTLLLSNYVLPLFTPKTMLADNELAQRMQDEEAHLDILRSVVQGLLNRQTSQNAVATSQVVEQYSERIEKQKDVIAALAADGTAEEQMLDRIADTELDMRLEVLDWERAYITEQIEAGNIEPLLGYRYLNRVDRRENALLHRLQRVSIANLAREAKELAKSTWQNVKTYLPGVEEDRQTAALADLHRTVYGLVVRKLKDVIAKGSRPAEAAGAVLMSYQDALAKMQATSKQGVRSATALVAEVEQLGINLELQSIREAYDAGKLSRRKAKELRDTITLMQVELGEE